MRQLGESQSAFQRCQSFKFDALKRPICKTLPECFFSQVRSLIACIGVLAHIAGRVVIASAKAFFLDLDMHPLPLGMPEFGGIRWDRELRLQRGREGQRRNDYKRAANNTNRAANREVVLGSFSLFRVGDSTPKVPQVISLVGQRPSTANVAAAARRARMQPGPTPRAVFARI